MTTVDQSYDIVWVETDAELASWCKYWSTLDVIAVDTEFLRRTTYYPITGLIQISEGEKAVLIDPQTITEWAPLKSLMVDLSVIKVFHACSEDLDVFDRLLGVLPTPFYDTQIGEAYANGQWSVSYVKLIQSYLNIEVAKDETRSDWTVRPLTEAQKRYAALDVIYLAKVYPQQIEMLQKKAMLEWALEDCDTLKWQYKQNGDPEANWSNVKAAWRLSPKSLTLLRLLFIWREEQAKLENVPKGQVLKDRSLWAIAKFMPDHHKAIAKIEDLTGKQHRLYGDTILEKVKVVQSLSGDEYQLMLPTPLPSQAGELSKSIKSYIKQRSEELGVAPEAVMKRKLLDPIVRYLYEGGELDWSNPAMLGWRKDKIVEPILSNFGEQPSN